MSDGNKGQTRRHWLNALLLSGGLLTACWAQAQSGAERPTYAVSVVPQFQATDIHRVWGPILAQIGQMAGVNLVLKVAKDIPSFEDDVMTGKADLAYMNPYHQVMAHQAQGYVPLVRDAKLLTGILVVRRDDPIKSVKELQGKPLSFPAPNAFGASLLIRSHLAEVDHIETVNSYAKTHTNAYRQTILGKSAASGGIRSTLDKEPDEVKAALRVLMETPGAAPHPLSAHPRVPQRVQEAIAGAVIKLATDPAWQASFKEIPMPQPVRADYKRDYQSLEKLRIDKFVE